MTWLATATPATGHLAETATAAAGGNGANPYALLPRGSIVVETRLSPEGRPQKLFDLKRSHPWPANISLQAIPGDGIAIILSQGNDLFHKVLRHQCEGRTDVLRVTFSWDAPARWGRLAIEQPENDFVLSVATPAPPPLMIDDLRVLAQKPQLRQIDRDLSFIAVSDRIEPVGPMPKLTASVPVATPRGYVPAGDLKRGDTVFAASGDIVPVLHNIRRIVPALGRFTPVRLRAPYFGLRRDIATGSELRLCIDGSEVEYLFGTEAVLCPARHLVNGTAAVWEEGHHLVEYVHPVLPMGEVIDCAGTLAESLYLGRIRRKPEALAASLLARLPRHELPEHRPPAWPVLKPFEAITLAENRAA